MEEKIFIIEVRNSISGKLYEVYKVKEICVHRALDIAVDEIAEDLYNKGVTLVVADVIDIFPY